MSLVWALALSCPLCPCINLVKPEALALLWQYWRGATVLCQRQPRDLWAIVVRLGERTPLELLRNHVQNHISHQSVGPCLW